MKGVSAIISIILIVMIVVALAGMTYTWFKGLVGTVAQSAENATSSATTSLGMSIQIIANSVSYSSNKVNVTFRNTGTVNINLAKIGALINNTYCPTYSPNTGIMAPGAVQIISITNATAACPNKVLRLTTESGYEDYMTIAC